MTLVEIICQAAIPVTGLAASFMVGSKSQSMRKRAGLVGLAGQPFWFVSAWLAGQWGIFVLCFFYTYTWARVVRNNGGEV